MTSLEARSFGLSRSPLSVAQEALARGRRLDAELEAYVQYGRTVNVKVFAGEVESVTLAEPRGLGVRAVRSGRAGYAFSADLSTAGIDRVLTEAVGNLEAADADPLVHLPAIAPSDYPLVPGLWRPGVGQMGLQEKISLALEAETAALALPDMETVEEAVYSDEEAWVAVASTAGVEVEAEQSHCFVYVLAHAWREGDRQSGLGYSAGREPSNLDPHAAGGEAAGKARALLGARPCATGLYTVVLDREVVAALFCSIAQALSADAVHKGRSIFADKLGQAVASPLVTLIDDGLAVEGLATSPFDGEGVPQQTTTLFEAGVLQTYLHNSYTALKAGGEASSSGNAARGSYRSPPVVGATNLVIQAGEGSADDLLARVGEGLYVQDVAGVHSGVNAISGEISVGATGRMIQGGCVGMPVREVTVAADFKHLLENVSYVAGDARWVPLYGSAYAPSLAVADVAVSGA